MKVAQHARPHVAVEQDEPRLWLAPSPLIDLEDPKLRLRVHALTQLCKSEREKALAIYGFVKRLPMAKRFRLNPNSARGVLDAGRGDAPDKATLLVAMLRIAGIPARIRYLAVRGEILRGITSVVRQAVRPVVEVWLHDGWVQNDTYIFDAAYMAAARQRLKERGLEWGYGIHVAGEMMWDGYQHSYVTGRAPDQDPMALGDLGVFDDPSQFIAARSSRGRHMRIARVLQWSLLAPRMERAIRELRDDPGDAALRPRTRTRS